MRLVLTALLLPALVALAVSLTILPRDGAYSSTESAYDRVINSGTIRCGYALWPGLLTRDPNSHEFSGLMHDYMAKLAQATELKVEWTEEVSYGDMPEALRAGRIDAFCGGAWTNAVRGKYADPVTPVAYQTINAYTHAGNMALDGDADKINNQNVTISVADGESASVIAKADFPQAKTFALPKDTDMGQLLLNVVNGKADVAFVDPEAGATIHGQQSGQDPPGPHRFPGARLWRGLMGRQRRAISERRAG